MTIIKKINTHNEVVEEHQFQARWDAIHKMKELHMEEERHGNVIRKTNKNGALEQEILYEDGTRITLSYSY